MSQEAIDEGSKLYKENPYKNTNGDFFGVSIKGRAKEYLQAHKKFQDLVQKGKNMTSSMYLRVKRSLEKESLSFSLLLKQLY